ncbi:psychosine receptor-like [Polypterus senegalus]|uniref:psychosine receptor-like n=1 Tax=Polypterus senegalus TaxID=55291 RepID=UPI0019649197|nr:psychosine receptor-like [Polypterus senegalus]XP_039597934.1 psychosine receptor-like [Polypterus senegalus]
MDNESTEHYNASEIVISLVYISVTIFSIPANLLSLFEFSRQLKKKNELAVYHMNLAVADLLLSISLPFWVYIALEHPSVKKSAALTFNCFLTFLNYYGSATFLCCIAVDRYLAIVYPLRFYVLRKVKFAVYISFIIWTLQLLLTSVLVFSSETITDSNSSSFCTTTCSDNDWKVRTFSFLRFFIGFFIPSSLIIFCGYGIYKGVMQNKATGKHEKSTVNKLLLGIIVTFLICFGPYHVVLLICSVKNYESSESLELVVTITGCLITLNCIADPLLYCFVHEKARKNFVNTMLLCKKRHCLCSNDEV